jgi:hypothetical protein
VIHKGSIRKAQKNFRTSEAVIVGIANYFVTSSKALLLQSASCLPVEQQLFFWERVECPPRDASNLHVTQLVVCSKFIPNPPYLARKRRLSFVLDDVSEEASNRYVSFSVTYVLHT